MAHRPPSEVHTDLRSLRRRAAPRVLGLSGSWLLFLGACALFWSGPVEAQDLQLVRVDLQPEEEPVAPPLLGSDGMPRAGQGLCGAFRADPRPDTTVFPNRTTGFPGDGTLQKLQDAINTFMDERSGTLQAGKRWDGTLLTPFDLANNTNLTGITSEGDYVGTPACAMFSSHGCPFPPMNKMGDPKQGFGSRFRGFLNVPPAWVNQTLHFGFYADDAVSMMLWTRKPDPADRTKFILAGHVLLSRAKEDAESKYRVSQAVKFYKAGLYPIEIVHASLGSAAVLEFAVLPYSTITLQSGMSIPDFDAWVSTPPPKDIPPLPTLRFALDFTQKEQFFQTATGALSFPDPAQCQQCPRSEVNQRVHSCGASKFCNEAALCAPCQGDQFCGSSCLPCSDPKPYCVKNAQKTDFECVQCREDKDCAQGLKCVQGSCVNPCTCCPDSPYCIETDAKSHPGIQNCSQCRSDTDCGAGKCDLLNARCVDAVPECNQDDRCGAECVNCREISKDEPNGPRPFCLYGKACAQCRFDYDCKSGSFCRSGDCVPCTHDRHCGPSCSSCGLAYQIAPDGKTVTTSPADRPYCLAPGGQFESATCVSCLVNAHCGKGGVCNPATHVCDNTCQVACEPGKICNGDRCVECVTSSQCPCGQCVDGACSPSCADTTDCNSMQCCQKSTGQCVREKCAPDTAAGGALCCSTGSLATSSSAGNGTESPAGSSGSARASLLALLGLLALLCRYRLRPPWRQT